MPIQDQPAPLVAEAQRVLTSPVERELFCVAYYPDWLGDEPDVPLSDATWNTELANLSSTDAEQLRKQLVRWQQLRSGKKPPPAMVTEQLRSLAPSLPLRLLQPGAQYHPELHVSSPDLEQRILGSLREGVSVTLYGGYEQGKSWWIQHILRTLQEHAEVKTLYVDLSRWSTEVLGQRHSLFRKLREEFIRELKLSASELHGIPSNPEGFDEVWPVLAVYHQRPECRAQHIVLALDGTNALLDSPTVEAFFRPLRTLMQDTDYMSLLVSLSAPLGLRSSVSFGETQVVPDLPLKQLEPLAEKYGVALGTDDQQRLWKLLCGQPYLVRLALYQACRESTKPLSLLLEEAACLPNGGTLFSDYFANLRAQLNREQLDTLHKVYSQEEEKDCPEEQLRQLKTQGLIVPQQRGGHRLHCRLFLHLLRQ